jgi:hypothetical protein
MYPVKKNVIFRYTPVSHTPMNGEIECSNSRCLCRVAKNTVTLGNQTLQWKILHPSMIFPLKPPFRGDFPLPEDPGL